MNLPAESTDFKNALGPYRSCEKTEEFPLGSGDSNISQTVVQAVFADKVEHVVLANDELAVVGICAGPVFKVGSFVGESHGLSS